MRGTTNIDFTRGGQISYDNSSSGLSATNVQNAIDELADEKVDKTDIATGVIGKNLSATSHTIDGWNVVYCAIIVGFMNDVGGFVGTITGTTYTPISGADMAQNNRLTLSLSGSTLTLNGVSTFTFTFIMQ